jgi:hypothetical protein
MQNLFNISRMGKVATTPRSTTIEAKILTVSPTRRNFVEVQQQTSQVPGSSVISEAKRELDTNCEQNQVSDLPFSPGSFNPQTTGRISPEVIEHPQSR